MKKFIGIGLFALVVIIGVTIFFMKIGIENKEIKLREITLSQNNKCEAYFDKMWKILQQKAKVSNEYKEAFKDIYPQLISGRYSKGDGTLMKWIQESNPQFDASLYKDLMKSIEIERTGFFNEQTILIDKHREHKVFIKTAPNRWFLGSHIKEVKIKVITSEVTEGVYKTGQENNIDLF